MNLRRRLGLAAALFATLFATVSSGATLEEIKARGRISFAVYEEFPPFHDKGKGIEIDLGHALAEKLGVKASFLPFAANDESIEADLRNMVWRGHYTGYGPADVMFHVPVTSELMNAERRNVLIFAPYYTEKLGIARDSKKVPLLDSLAPFEKELIGAEMASISSHLLITAEGGKFKGNVKHFRLPSMAIEALKKGEVAGVMAQRSELQGLLHGTSGFDITDAPFPQNRMTSWPVGMAVQKDNVALEKALAAALGELKTSGELQKIFAKYGVIAP
jgi:ABC-type amino acid transport substrate-binding protein